MRENYYGFKIVLVFFFFTLANIRGQLSSLWKGSVEVEDGIKIIKNPSEPLYGRLNLELQEELSIGKQDSEEYSFSLISDVKSDAAGNIYVADTKNLRVQKFDRHGNFLKTLGKGGVQFEQPSEIRIDPRTGYIFVRASVKDIEIFDKEDRHKGGIHLTQDVIHGFDSIDDSSVMAVRGLEYRDDHPRVMHSLCQLATNNEIRRMSQDCFSYGLQRVGEGWMGTGTDYDPDLYLAKLNGDSYVYGYSKNYELNVIDKEGKLLYRIKKEGTMPAYTPADRKVIGRYSFPDLKPYFFRLLTDSEGRIYVQRNITKGLPNAVQENTNRDVDVFSQDGYFLYTAVLPPNACEIKDGFLYTYVVDEAHGLETVKRYKIKNWEKIRVGI
jgi:hypothetical protein